MSMVSYHLQLIPNRDNVARQQATRHLPCAAPLTQTRWECQGRGINQRTKSCHSCGIQPTPGSVVAAVPHEREGREGVETGNWGVVVLTCNLQVGVRASSPGPLHPTTKIGSQTARESQSPGRKGEFHFVLFSRPVV